MISNDLILDTNNDLTIENGDFTIGQSDDQNIEAIMISEKGQFYEFPLLGYGIRKKLYGSFNKPQERKLIREDLKRDNYSVKSLVITGVNSNLSIEVDADKIK